MASLPKFMSVEEDFFDETTFVLGGLAVRGSVGVY
jgi:hypothetical protein